MYAMSSRTTGGTLAAWMIIAAIVGFAGGAFAGTQSDNDNPPRTEPNSSTTTPANTPKATKKPDPGLELTADKPSVGAMDEITFSGKVTPAQAGVQLRLERNVEGAGWEPFPNISTWTTDDKGAFSSTAASGQTGQNKFRVVQVDDESKKSNVVTVTIT